MGVFPKWKLVVLGSTNMLMLPSLNRLTVVGTLVLSCPAGKDIVAGPIYQVP